MQKEKNKNALWVTKACVPWARTQLQPQTHLSGLCLPWF